jgi:hypothetical protein
MQSGRGFLIPQSPGFESTLGRDPLLRLLYGRRILLTVGVMPDGGRPDESSQSSQPATGTHSSLTANELSHYLV